MSAFVVLRSIFVPIDYAPVLAFCRHRPNQARITHGEPRSAQRIGHPEPRPIREVNTAAMH